MDHLLSVSEASKSLAGGPWLAARASVPATPVVTEQLIGREALRVLQPVWNDVVARAGLEHPFATHEWISSWWDAFGDKACLKVLTTRSAGQVTAIAPLMRPQGSALPYQRGRWASLNNGHTPRFDWAIGGRPNDSYTALWQGLQEEFGDGLELTNVPDGSPTLDAIAGLARRDGWLVGVQPGAWSPHVCTRGTWEDYVASLSTRHRSNMRTRLSRLCRRGAVRLEVVAGGTRLGEALERGFWLESAAWKHRAGTAIVSTPPIKGFYVRLAERAAAQGWLRLLFLSVGQRRVAFAYALEYRDRLFLIKIGYDPDYARHSPGQLLFWCVLEAAFQSHVREVDFLGVGESWKRMWTNDGLQHCCLTILRNTVPGRVEHAVRFHAVPFLRRSPLYKWYHAVARRSHDIPDARSAHAR